ncbi:MAG: hypothetical protein DYG99_13240 [Bacteroidetes bacterium CHB5]|nr:hypothetical protein [Bacteroidetes bacterium CHB5]
MKLLNLNKPFVLLFATLTFGIFSCGPEQVDSKQSVTYLPSVLTTSSISTDHLTTIKKLNSSSRGRTYESLDFNAAIVATYDGYEGMELVYIPDLSTDDSFAVYTFRSGELIDLVLTIENTEEKMVVKSDAGTIVYNIDKNLITNTDIKFYSNFEAKTSGCNLASDFMACGSAVQDQLVEAVGSWGALAFDIGCSLWVVCRGAVALSCAAYAGVQCTK